jgi:acetyl esterase
MARDGTLPVRPVLQGLIYPATDLVMNHASHARPLSDVPLTPATMRWFADLYCPRPTDRLHWRASPLRATTLTGAAPAFVVTVGHDPLRDEGFEYASRLEREGVRVTHVDIADQIHGFLTMGRFMRVAGDTIAMLGTALRREWASTLA